MGKKSEPAKCSLRGYDGQIVACGRRGSTIIVVRAPDGRLMPALLADDETRFEDARGMLKRLLRERDHLVAIQGRRIPTDVSKIMDLHENHSYRQIADTLNAEFAAAIKLAVELENIRPGGGKQNGLELWAMRSLTTMRFSRAQADVILTEAMEQVRLGESEFPDDYPVSWAKVRQFFRYWEHQRALQREGG